MLVLVFSKQKQFVLSSARILVVCVQVSKQQLLNSIWSILKQCVYFTTCLEAYSGGWCPAQFWQDAIYWYLIWYMILYELAAIVNLKRFDISSSARFQRSFDPTFADLFLQVILHVRVEGRTSSLWLTPSIVFSNFLARPGWWWIQPGMNS